MKLSTDHPVMGGKGACQTSDTYSWIEWDQLNDETVVERKSSFSIKKEVRPEGSTEFFERNRYSWRR